MPVLIARVSSRPSAAHVLARALGGAAGAALATAEVERARQRLGQGLDLGRRAFAAAGVVPRLRFVEVGAQLAQALLVRGARVAIDQLARIAAVDGVRAREIEPGGWLLMGSPGAGDERQRAINELVGDVWGGPTIGRAAGLLPHDARAAVGAAARRRASRPGVRR